MDVKQCFLILGIEPVKDERRIKNAYREKLTVTNPEDDPEGFKRLREAYERACAYIDEADEENGQIGIERDTTPSGLWVERAESIYKSLRTRKDITQWEGLFDDDVFQSLEDEENCRNKLLRFLMDHFRLPGEVWKLFDKKMGLAQDAAALRELFPADFINFVISRCERGEDISFDQFEGADDADFDLFLNYYDDCWQALQEENAPEAERLLEEARGLRIFHPCMEICKAYVLLQKDKKQEAAELMEKLYERFPDDDMVGYHAAEIFWKLEREDRSAEFFLQLKARNEKHYMANVRLTQWYYDTGKYEEAKKCAEAVLSMGADDAFMELLTKVNAKLEQNLWNAWKKEGKWESALELCWCYLQDGATSRGLRLAREIESYITEERQAEYCGLLAKLMVEQGDYEDAISMSGIWEGKLKEKLPKDETEEERKKDEDRIKQSYMIRMQSYRYLGYRDKAQFAKAIEQIEAVETGLPKDIGLLIDKAQILMEMEEYERSLDISTMLIQDYQIYAAAASAMEVYRRQWDASGVVQNARICIQKFPSYVRAYEYLGKVYLDLKEYEQLKQLFEIAEQNQIKSVLLEAYRYQIDKKPPGTEVADKKLEEFQKEYQEPLRKGDRSFYEKGLPLITEYLYWYPEAYMLGRRASFYKDAKEYEKALADYERALADEPGNPYIHSNMSYIYRRQGEFEKALYHSKLAILYAEEGEWRNLLHCNLAKLYMLLGDNEKAYENYDHYAKQADQDTSYYDDMAECLARMHRTEEAKQKITVYYRKNGKEFYDGYRKAMVETLNSSEDFEQVQKFLAAWKREQKICDPWKNVWNEAFGFRNQVNKDTMDYYCMAGWEALRVGDGKLALRLLREQVRLEALQDKDSNGGLADLIFAAILYGEKEMGRTSAQKLRDWIRKDEKKAVRYYHDMPKAELMNRFLANYYIQTDEWLQELLDQEKQCAICDFCLLPRCKELEAMRILLMMRQGKTEAAKERLLSVLEVQPYDEYMLAIRAAFSV